MAGDVGDDHIYVLPLFVTMFMRLFSFLCCKFLEKLSQRRIATPKWIWHFFIWAIVVIAKFRERHLEHLRWIPVSSAGLTVWRLRFIFRFFSHLSNFLKLLEVFFPFFYNFFPLLKGSIFPEFLSFEAFFGLWKITAVNSFTKAAASLDRTLTKTLTFGTFNQGNLYIFDSYGTTCLFTISLNNQ